MTRVKEVLPDLMALLFRRVRDELGPAAAEGLRVSHLRVLSAVPPTGASVTALSDRVGMTKQGCGQFVSQLGASGHVRTVVDADDARVRRVVLTDKGERLLDDVAAVLDDLEATWAQQVGERRYATFRRVLEELATGNHR
jgi:DNA-binding MarR family transcriptional regulator